MRRVLLPWLIVAGVTSSPYPPPDYRDDPPYPPSSQSKPQPPPKGDPMMPPFLQSRGKGPGPPKNQQPPSKWDSWDHPPPHDDQLLNGMAPSMYDPDSSDMEKSDKDTLQHVNNLTQSVLNRANGYIDQMAGYSQYQGSESSYGSPPSYGTSDPNKGYGSPNQGILQYNPPYSQSWGTDHEKKPSNLGLWMGIAFGIVGLLALVLISICLFCYFRRRRNGQRSILPLPGNKQVNSYQKYEHSPALSSLSGHDPWELQRSSLIVDYENKLGSGAFCNVFKGRIVGEAPVLTLQPSLRTAQFRDCEVAVKMLPSFADDIARSDFMQEINFMKSLRYHQHLVSMLGYVSDRKSPMLIVEFCPLGDLLHYIRERKDLIQRGVDNESGVRIKEIVSFAWQIAQGLEYLNSVGCIHRDVAARNVLVCDNYVCKIGDFGLCRLTDSLLYTARGGRLPLKWMAPESLSTFEYSFKSDVWSYGILLWELFSLGEVPFAGVQTTDLLVYIRQGNRPDRPAFCTDEVWTLLYGCWRLEADKRPSFTELGREFGKILEIATENYGYLIPTSRISINSEMTRISSEEENSEISNV